MAVKEWFPHDYYASRDVRIMRLLRSGGALWYGLYWLAVEMLHCQDDVMEEDVIDGLVIAARCDRQDAERFLAFSIEQGLMLSQDGVLCSERVTRNLEMRKDISEKKRQAATKRWNADAMQVQCTSNADAMHVQCHNITEQNRIEQNREGPAPALKARPKSLLEASEYFVELGMPATEAQRFMDYYTANGWKVGKNPMKDWKAAARNWRKGWQDKQTQSGNTAARTQPTGLPAQVIEIASRPKLSETDVAAFREAYLRKVGPDDDLLFEGQEKGHNTLHGEQG